MKNNISGSALILAGFATKLLFAAFITFPFLWVVVTSFKPMHKIMSDILPFSIKALLPLPFTLEAYNAILSGGFGQSLIFTLFICLVSICFGILINSMAGFSFAKFSFPGKKIIFIFTLLSFLIPFEAISIPLYITTQRLGLLNTTMALILPMLANGLAIFLFRQFFSGIPDSLIESVRIDGGSWWTVYSRICIPLSKAVILTASLMIFLTQWQSFLWPLLAVQQKVLRVVQVSIAFLTSDQHVVYWNQIFAASTITSLTPLILLFPLQKYYRGGIATSGIKG